MRIFSSCSIDSYYFSVCISVSVKSDWYKGSYSEKRDFLKLPLREGIGEFLTDLCLFKEAGLLGGLLSEGRHLLGVLFFER